MLISVVKYLLIYSLCYIFSAFGERYQRVKYFEVERPYIKYVNPKYFTFVNVSARRYSRQDPVYYYNLHFVNIFPLGDNYTFNFYFYQFLTNEYKPSFVELHIKACTLFNKDPIFGPQVKRALLKIDPKARCPLLPGNYNMQNCTLQATVLPNFPFPRGRIYLNLTYNPTEELVGWGYVDFLIKEMKIKN